MSTSSGYQQKLIQTFQAFAAAQTFDYEPKTLYSPIRYIMSAGGKAIRPTLLLLAHGLGKKTIEPALPAAYAVELFHNFTLVHDDIMDEADLRRGRPTVHKSYDQSTAILAGDAMLIHTYGYLLDNYTGTLANSLLHIFQRMGVELCQGQQLDMDMEAGLQSDYALYLKMIHGKTGVLMTTALEMGGRIAGLADHQIAILRNAGDLAGRAFQIQDDVLDTFRTSAQTGKMDYGDIVRGKQSAPFVKALDVASPQQVARLQEIYAMTVDERSTYINEVLDIYRAVNVEKRLADEVVELSNEAVKLVQSIHGRPEATEALCALIDRLAGRAS